MLLITLLIKHYGKPEQGNETKYSPAQCTGTEKRRIQGRPDNKLRSTSYVERQNLTMRMNMRRSARLTNGFPKKLEKPLMRFGSLLFMHYHFASPHKTLAYPYPRTPAMAAGLTDHLWTIEEIVKFLKEKKSTASFY